MISAVEAQSDELNEKIESGPALTSHQQTMTSAAFENYLYKQTAPKTTPRRINYTRIGDRALNIKGGSFQVEDEVEFRKRYYINTIYVGR